MSYWVRCTRDGRPKHWFAGSYEQALTMKDHLEATGSVDVTVEEGDPPRVTPTDHSRLSTNATNYYSD